MGANLNFSMTRWSLKLIQEKYLSWEFAKNSTKAGEEEWNTAERVNYSKPFLDLWYYVDTQRVHIRPNWIWLQTDWCCNMSEMYVEIWSKWISKDSVKSKRCHSGASQAEYLVSCQFMGSILDTEYNSHGNRIDPTLLIKNGKNLSFSVPPTLEGWEGWSRVGCQQSLVL